MWFQQQVIILSLLYLHWSILNLVEYAKVLTKHPDFTQVMYIFFFLKRNVFQYNSFKTS